MDYLDKLTTREYSVYQMILKGYSACEMAVHLNITSITVKTHIATILRKCQATDRYVLMARHIEMLNAILLARD